MEIRTIRVYSGWRERLREARSRLYLSKIIWRRGFGLRRIPATVRLLLFGSTKGLEAVFKKA